MESEPNTFFLTLCTDELTTIIRHLSRAPRSRVWRQQISRDDFLQVTDADSAFKSAVGRVFSKLDITYEAGPRQAPAEDGHKWGECVLEQVGGVVEELTIADRPDTFPRQVQPLPYHRVMKYCPNPRILTLHLDRKSCQIVPLSEIVQRYSTKLEGLSVLTHLPGHLASVLVRNPFPNLTFLRLSGDEVEKMVPVLHALGSTLEHVDLFGRNTNWTAVLDTLRIECRNLTAIHLKGRIGEDEHATFLMTFGKQLRSATLRGMQSAVRERVMMACPNLICTTGREARSTALTVQF